MRHCESRVRLLQTAHELISRLSYGSVGVDQICEHSRVKKGSFYHFFRSKSELTVAAYEHHWQSVQAMLESIFCSRQTPLERLENYFDYIQKSQHDNFVKYGHLLGCSFVSIGSELSTQDERIRQMAQEICERRRRYLAHTLQEAIAEGSVRAGDAKLMAKELHSYVTGLVQEAKIANDIGILERLKPGAHRILGLQLQSVS